MIETRVAPVVTAADPGTGHVTSSGRRWLAFPVLVLASVLIALHASPDVARSGPGRTLFVATTGHDANEGSEASPLRTIQRGLDLARPGDTILVRAGIYREYVVFQRSGRRGAPISLLGFPGETVTLAGTGLNWRYGVDLQRFDHLRIGHLRIHDYIRDGVRGYGVGGAGDNDDIELSGLRFEQVGTPIKFAATTGPDTSRGLRLRNIVARQYDGGGIDLGPGKVAGVVIRGVRLHGHSGGNDTAVDGIAVEDGTGIRITGATITGHPGDGIDLKAGSVLVRRVRVLGARRDGLKLWRDARVENAIIAGAGLTALVLDGPGPFEIVNSLFANAPGYNYTVTAGQYGSTDPTEVALWNNTFATPDNGGTLVYAAEGAQLTGDNNLYWAPERLDAVICDQGGSRCFSGTEINNGAWSVASGMDGAAAFADPRFLDPASSDYHLQSRSPAIDAGDDGHAPGVDLDGRRRPVGAHADVGPYEWTPDRPPR